MWNIVFNKANDITKMSTKELREKRDRMDEEITRRRRDKYKAFLYSIAPGVKDLFISSYIEDINSVIAFEDETVPLLKRSFTLKYIDVSDANEIFIDIEDCKISFYMYTTEEALCSSSDCQKTIDFLVWLLEN